VLLVISHHYCDDGRIEEAIERLDANSDRMTRAAGFLFRHRMQSEDDPLKLSTLTAWADQAAYDAYQSVPKPPRTPAPYSQIETEIYLIERSWSA
jgi:heme-degrading monooxygenase HmoA